MPVMTLHEKQEWTMDSTSRFIICVSGIQGGKTTIGTLWFLREIYESYRKGQRGDWLIAAPTAKILQQSTLPKFRQFFPKDWGEWREQRQCFDLKWTMPGGDEPCRIYVRSTDEPDHLEGMTILGAWMDEAGQMKTQAWVNIQGRLSINLGRCIMTTTPYAMGWFWRDIVKRAHKRNREAVIPVGGDGADSPTFDKSIEMFSWTSADNPAFPREEFERARATLPDAIFKRRYCGQFTRLEGLVYSEFDYEKHVIEAFPVPGEWKRFAGMDFGQAKPSAIVCVAEEPAVLEDKEHGIAAKPSCFYIYSEFYKAGSLLHQMAEFLNREPLSYTLADPSAQQEIAELSRFFGVKRVLNADNEIDVGTQRVNSLFKENRLKIFRNRAPNVLDEIETYHYREPSLDRETADKPVAVKNHAMDAMKYAFSRTREGIYGPRKNYAAKRFARRAIERQVDRVTGY